MEIDGRDDDPAAAGLQLLLRPYCLLCLEAEHMLALAGIAEFERVDIERDPALEARYGTVIPVLRRADGGELAWPFSPGQIRALVTPAH